MNQARTKDQSNYNLLKAVKESRIYRLEQKWKKFGIYRVGKDDDSFWDSIK